MPALLQRTSTAPHSRQARSARASTSARRLTSVRTVTAREPALLTAAAVSFIPASSTSATTTARAPSAAKARQSARPMPLPPPVTTATRSRSVLTRGEFGPAAEEMSSVAPRILVSSNVMDYRLPTSVVPSRYELRLVPDLDAATFAGEETVTVTIREPVSEITLNAAELAIQSVSARDAAGAAVEGTATLDEAQERARLLFPSPLAPGEWRLTLAFTGVLNDRLHGFYRST